MYTTVEVIYGIVVHSPLSDEEANRLFSEQGEDAVAYFEDLLNLTDYKKKNFLI